MEQIRKLEQARQQLARKNREITRLRAELARTGAGSEADGIRSENMIWMFGVARTGSTWLSAMMADIRGHARWNEPYVGDVFGFAYYLRARERQRNRKEFILSDHHKEVWLRSVRSCVLDGARARYPRFTENDYLVIKEPNGSIGAPLLLEAFPESRMILLVRDPRDVVASLLAAHKKGGWAASEVKQGNKGGALADTNPGEFVRTRARMYVTNIEKARQAYEAHRGLKVAVRYEDVRYNALDELKRIFFELDILVGEDELRRVVEKHAWENVPEERKGPNKPRRKATPGGWREDLTPGEAEMVEEITASVLQEFYSKDTVRVQPG